MKAKIKLFILTTALLLCTILLFYSLVICYYNFTDNYFYKGDFHNEKANRVYLNYMLSIKIIPIVLLILSIFFIKKQLKTTWKIILPSLIIILIIFPSTLNFFSSLFTVTNNHILNNLMSIGILFTITALTLNYIKKINSQMARI